MTPAQQQQFKYALTVDGKGLDTDFASSLLGGSCAVKQTSPYYEMYHKWLTAGEHFLPVAYSLADLPAQVRAAGESRWRAAVVRG
jgi:hypothetical protein